MGTCKPFFMRILDEQDLGIPNARVVSDNGIVCRTLGDGSVRWTERWVMNRDCGSASTRRTAAEM